MTQPSFDLNGFELQSPFGEGDGWVVSILSARSDEALLRAWVAVRGTANLRTCHDVSLALSRDIADLDQRISRQLNAVLCHEAFQQLESSWRGVQYLVEHVTDRATTRIMLLNASWREIARDVDGAMDYTHTQLYRRVCLETFETLGGQPFGLLVGDFAVRHMPGEDYSTDDVNVLGAIAQIGEDCFVPFIASAAPQFLGLDSFAQLDRLPPLLGRFKRAEYARWNAFRQQSSARFVALTFPRFVLRPAWNWLSLGGEGFSYDPTVGTSGRDTHLWGNATWLYAAAIIRSYEQTGWFTDISGARDADSGGCIGDVGGVPLDRSLADLLPRPIVETVLTERREREAAELGLIPLCHLQYTGMAAFFSNSTVQIPQTYTTGSGTANARLSTMLQYVLCVCRIGHYLKSIARHKIGSFLSPAELEGFLQTWLTRYTVDDDNASGATKASYPMKQIEVKVQERSGRPGAYQCMMHLLPHSQWDAMTAHIQLRTEISTGRR